jgi:hypothetical protein
MHAHSVAVEPDIKGSEELEQPLAMLLVGHIRRHLHQKVTQHIQKPYSIDSRYRPLAPQLSV